CRHFARHAQQTQWDEIDYDTGPLGCPIPNDAVAWMECRRTRYYLGGDHYIILGQVMTLDVEKKSDATRPLLYYRSKIFPENKSAKKKL
ncbi:MAG: flavin reductase, partial [Alphaproteobacteria bacterium]|nr:flavin reductase [Alphaproteobacteria bacterium]